MTNTFRARSLAWFLTVVSFLASAPSARAQTIPPNPTARQEGDPTPSVALQRPSLLRPFWDVLGDIRHLPTRGNADWLVIGMVAAIGAHPADNGIAHSSLRSANPTFEPGAIVGGTPFELGAAFATYAIGRASHSPRMMRVGGDLIRAQLLAELMTVGVKQSFRRVRPEGSGFSFPSGHTTVAFASATVLQQHFGWRVGIPAYAVASYVAASRVELKRHYLSDVAFGAALGIIAGRTVNVGRDHRLLLTPMATTHGAAATFTLMGKK